MDLSQVRGVEDVADVDVQGGYVKQYEVAPDLAKLTSYGLTRDSIGAACTMRAPPSAAITTAMAPVRQKRVLGAIRCRRYMVPPDVRREARSVQAAQDHSVTERVVSNGARTQANVTPA